MPQLRYDPIAGKFIPVVRGPAAEADPDRERQLTMLGHDALPPEWRELSRQVKGRSVELMRKKGTPLAKAMKDVVRMFGGSV